VPRGGTRSLLLPLLGALLALGLLGGVMLALRGARGASDQIGAAATAPAQALAGTSAPTLPPGATIAPADQSGTATAGAVTPAPVADPIVPLRELLLVSARGGQLGQDVDTLITTLDAAQRALNQGDGKTATAQLQALQQQLLTGARSGTITPAVMRQALSGIDAIARSHGLTLSFSVISP